MAYSDESFSKQLDQVKDQFGDLSSILEEVCENLKEPGSPPPSEILTKIKNATDSFDELKSSVTKWAQDVQMPDTEAQELDSLKAIKTFSKNIAAHQEHLQQDEKVLEYINRARSIIYAKEGESFPPLEDFHRNLDNLEKRISTSSISDEGQNERTQILENRHPINGVLTLLEHGEELDQESYDQISEIISEQYGHSFMIATVRGNLIPPEIPDPKEPQPQQPPDTEEESEESEPKGADDLPVEGQAEVWQEEISEEPPTVKTQKEPDESETESIDDLPVDGQVEVRPEEIREESPTTTTQKEPDKSGSESVDDSPIGGKAPIEVEVKKEKTESQDVSDKDGITELKEEIYHDLPDKEVPAELSFCFNASETAQSIASSLKSADYTFERGFPDLFWALIQENRLSLAYWLARYIENKELDLSFIPPSYLIEALIHGLAVQNETDSSAHCLYDIYNEKFESLESKESGYDTGIRLLVIAGALRPSLFAPHTGAHTVLKSHAPLPGLDAFFAIGQAVEKFAEKGLPIITDNLTNVKDDQQWQEELDSLIKDATEWLEHAPKMRMKYRPLERIWQGFVTEGKWIHNFVSPVIKNDEKKTKDVLALIQQCGSKRRIKDQVENQVDRVVKHKLKCGLEPLEKGVQEAVDFASRWVKLCKQRPKQSQDYLTGLIRTLRVDIQHHADTARDQLNVFAEQHKDFKPILAGIEISHQVLNAITRLLNGEIPQIEYDDRGLLSAELLKIPNLELTEEWTPTGKALDNLGYDLVQHIALPEPDRTWVKAFEKQTNNRNHWATKHILDLMATAMDDNGTVAKLEEARQEAIGQCITALENDIEATKKKIGNSVWNSILTDQEQSGFVQLIAGIDPKKILNFRLEHRRLETIRKQIDKKNIKRIEECKNQLEQLSISKDDRGRINTVLKRGDVGTAEEFISLLGNGEKLPDLGEDNWVDRFQDFFPKAVKEFEVLSKEKQPQRIISRIKSGRSIGPLSMDNVPSAQGQEAADVLATWNELKRRRGDKFSKRFREGISRILGWLGFEVQNISQYKLTEGTENRLWIPFTATVSSRCPIPAFGSASEGQYRLMCVWAQPGEDEILDWIDQGAKRQATIVFYFNRMTIQERQDLARSTRASYPPFLLIDENQLLFLCNERGARLPTLFDCAMPFARINPYTPFAAGNIPPEMFFGREQEANSLMDRYGSCLIYGGRQLGKTALLRYIEREFEKESEEHKAIFLDLKTNGIPRPRLMDALWPALGKCLRDKGVIPKSQTSHKPNVLLERIKQWIDGRPNRRVLLLLDESDDFLEIDANEKANKEHFVYVDRLKRLMDNTDRRFKVVFAGLHNVQRFSKIPNQPLAHLGRPISIGPLKPRAAQDLMVKPLRTLGYRFDDLDLVVKILFQMNFYPNLIQLFCNELLRYLWKTSFSPHKTPPYIILEKHIEDVYQSQDLRSQILERFNWTLDLDKRYRFIAYKIAYEIGAGAGEEGFEVNWIADEARREWPKGFAETSHNDEIRGLLDEMVGLGILVKMENERYGLRSPNVLGLLGTDNQIEDQLIEIMEYDSSPEFDPNSFRRLLNDKNSSVRSPFTAVQEADILKSENDIRLIFGSEGLGIEYVSQGVEVAVEDEAGDVYLLNAGVKRTTRLRSWLQECIDNTEEGHVVLIIPLEQAGTEPEKLIEWIETARNVIRPRRSEKRIIRILFLVPPEAARVWFRVPTEKREELTAGGGRLLLLKRWNDAGLRYWLEDLHIAPNSDGQRKEILDVTGGWPIFMKDFVARCLKKEMDWKNAVEEIREAQQKLGDDYRQRFGITQMDCADQVWTTLCEWCPIEFSDLIEVIKDGDSIKDISPEDLRQVVDYFDCLSLLQSGTGEQICPETVAAAMTSEG